MLEFAVDDKEENEPKTNRRRISPVSTEWVDVEGEKKKRANLDKGSFEKHRASLAESNLLCSIAPMLSKV